MSIEKRLEELTEAINTLPAAIAAVLGSAQSGNATLTTANKTPVQEQEKVDSKPETGEKVEEKSDVDVAGRKTYVFNKTDKTGFIVEKGEELPVGDEFVKVAKTKWEQLCEKYELDVETGAKVEAPAEEAEEDFDEIADDSTSESEGDDDLDLGLDDEPEAGTIDRAEVKKRMIDVMRDKGREDALKLFKKFNARNFDEVKDEDLQSLYDTAGKLLK